MIPCMGGWCRSRERCANYYAQSPLTPSERLCGSVEEPNPIRMDPSASDGVAERGLGDSEMLGRNAMEIRPLACGHDPWRVPVGSLG